MNQVLESSKTGCQPKFCWSSGGFLGSISFGQWDLDITCPTSSTFQLPFAHFKNALVVVCTLFVIFEFFPCYNCGCSPHNTCN